MPGPGRAYGAALADAVRDGSVSAEDLDGQVGRLLSVYERLGVLDQSDDTEPPPRPGPDRRATVARRAATASMVLLKNTGLLPLSKAVGSVAVVGPNADVSVIMGGGSAGVEPDHRTSPLEALRAKLGPGVTIVPTGGDLARATAVLRIPLAAEYFSGLRVPRRGRPYHRTARHRASCILVRPSPPWRAPSPSGPRGSTGRRKRAGIFFTLTHVGRARLSVDGVVVLDGFQESLPGVRVSWVSVLRI